MAIKTYILKNAIVEATVEEYLTYKEEVQEKKRRMKAEGNAAEIAKQKQQKERRTVFLSSSDTAQEALSLAGICYEGEINLNAIEFCKVETQKKCICGNLNIPRLNDVLVKEIKLCFFVNRQNIVIIDDENFAEKIVQRIIARGTNPGQSRERFLYSFCANFMVNDLENLSRYEKNIMQLEESIAIGELDNVTATIAQLRKELLVLREYYDELDDLAKELEENENNFFSGKNLEYFGTISDRADRLMGRTMYLLDYVGQVRDTYQGKVAEQQNENMQFLTIVSTIFFPLTLITGWYGMNFENMPELAQGYPFVIVLSLVIIAVVILIFKKRKIL